jgi:hypothetical protein
MVIVAPSAANPDVVPLGSKRWQIDAEESEVATHLGRESLKLKGGVALVGDADFTDGIIEFDIAASGERGFMGVVWRAQDAKNYEHFYIRPHLSGMPDACQYTPVFNGVSGWQLYHGAGYNASVDYVVDRWMPVKIVVSGRRADVYVNDMVTPLFAIDELARGEGTGTVGLLVSDFAPGYFSRFRFERMGEAPLRAAAADEASPPSSGDAVNAAEGTVREWLVSSAVDERSLDGVTVLDETRKRALTWTRLSSEPAGAVNIARAHGRSDDRNTAFVKLVVNSERAQGKLLRFGYSDRARVYLNDRLLYVGDNSYQSRDYRFLGTIGLFDGLLLPLDEGRNELWIAVSEDFGGWGVIASFPDMGEIDLGLAE